MKLAIFIVLFVSCGSLYSQGTFQNLDFELANPGPITFSFSVPVSSALPDWTVAIGGVQQANVGYNAFSTGAPTVTLISANIQSPPLDGNYSVMLESSDESTAISQTGNIPLGTQSLFFDAQKGSGSGGNGNLVVTIGSQTVSTVPVAVEPNFVVYGANISAWAGTTESLTFTAPAANSAFNIWELDDISFSSNAVPEQNPVMLSGIAGCLFAGYRRFVKRK
jgi:hypothetical protein